jgi:hypothetical protein
MPRWLSSLLIVIGFLALIGLAFVPRSVNVEVNVDGRAVLTNEGGGAIGAEAAPPE